MPRVLDREKKFFLSPTPHLFKASTIWQTLGPKIHTRWATAGRPQQSTGCVLTAATQVKHLLDQWDLWLGGPFIVFPETLPSSGQPSLGERSPHQNTVAAVAICCSSHSLLWPGSQASNALYTEFGCTLPSL